ncbi:MAG: hypothetical protein WA669_13785 [Pseudolabrys sp.]
MKAEPPYWEHRFGEFQYKNREGPDLTIGASFRRYSHNNPATTSRVDEHAFPLTSPHDESLPELCRDGNSEHKSDKDGGDSQNHNAEEMQNLVSRVLT